MRLSTTAELPESIMPSGMIDSSEMQKTTSSSEVKREFYPELTSCAYILSKTKRQLSNSQNRIRTHWLSTSGNPGMKRHMFEQVRAGALGVQVGNLVRNGTRLRDPMAGGKGKGRRAPHALQHV